MSNNLPPFDARSRGNQWPTKGTPVQQKPFKKRIDDLGYMLFGDVKWHPCCPLFETNANVLTGKKSTVETFFKFKLEKLLIFWKIIKLKI